MCDGPDPPATPKITTIQGSGGAPFAIPVDVTSRVVRSSLLHDATAASVPQCSDHCGRKRPLSESHIFQRHNRPFHVWPVPLPAELREALCHPFEPSFDVAAEVNADDASSFATEREEIAEGLGALEQGKPIGLTRNRNVVWCISREHDEHARVRSTFMELARGMQVARTVPEGSGHSEAVAECATERL
jgi:hypothetical protein